MNKVALSVNDDKRIQTPNEVISNLYGTGPGRVKRRTDGTSKNKILNIMINFDRVTRENRQ